MKKILVIGLAILLSARSASADCVEDLGVNFSPNQVKILCGTFSDGTFGVLANATWAVARNVGDTANINVWEVNTSDDTVFNSSASDDLILQLEDDASRLIFFDAGSDAALRMAFGDAGTTATQILLISASTSDSDDDSSIRLAGGGAFGTDGTRGATIVIPGEEVSGGSDITYNAGAGDTHIFQVAGTSEAILGDDSLAMQGTDTVITWADAEAQNDLLIQASTADADDDGILSLAGGGTAAVARGAFMLLKGNEASGAGDITLEGGNTDGSNALIRTNHANSTVTIASGAATTALTISAAQLATFAAGVTVTTGNITAAAGSVVATLGDVTISAGDLTITAGDLNVPAAANLGLIAENAANTACDTTCTQGCIAGYDAGTSAFVACVTATADSCLCAAAGS